MAKGNPKGNPQNLRPWKKGQSGNPKGAQKKLPALDKLMAEVLGSTDDDGEKSEAKAILQALINKAKKGDTRAAEILLDRGYGKPKEKLEITEEIRSFKIVAAKKHGEGNSSE